LRIDSLSLFHFRNYAQQSVSFCPGLNLLSGPNGHGKTNLLEAIHYGCLAHSQRTRKDKELIEWNQGAFVLRLLGRLGNAEGVEREHVQSVEYMESGHKRVKVNATESKRLSDLIGHFSVVSFSPEDLDLIRGGPQLRRRFLDVLLCQFSLDYLDTLRRYNQALKQRNSLLKQMGRGSAHPGGGFGDDVLSAYDAPLAEAGTRITMFRRRALAELSPIATACYHSISDGGESLSLNLAGCVSGDGSPNGSLDGSSHGKGPEDEGALRLEFLRKLESMRVPEREAGVTLVGPHREDLLFFLSGKPVREFGSQGQKRSVALSVKLASAQLLEAKNRQPPILLLDDVFAELDEARRKRIGDLVRNKGQVFIANPRAADLPFEAEKVITLRRGSVVSE
jgi:DNA replication and repair protein RecF